MGLLREGIIKTALSLQAATVNKESKEAWSHHDKTEERHQLNESRRINHEFLTCLTDYSSDGMTDLIDPLSSAHFVLFERSGR